MIENHLLQTLKSHFSLSFFWNKWIKLLPTSVATGLDGISPPLLKLISPVILKSLTKVLNCSIQSGTFPSALKLARVTLVHKSGPTMYHLMLNVYLCSLNDIVSTQFGSFVHTTQLSLWLRSIGKSGFRRHSAIECEIRNGFHLQKFVLRVDFN